MVLRLKLTRAENYQHYAVPANTIYSIELEEYLRHVVPSEMSVSWKPEAIKTQAVCARSYAAYNANQRASKTYDMDDTTNFQSFHANRSDSRSDAAIQATSGIFVLYDGKVAYTVFSSSNGGETESSKERWGNALPYLIDQKDPWTLATRQAKSGHGVGMSQYGAQYAATLGKTYQEILAFYFPGTTLGTINGKSVAAAGTGSSSTQASADKPASPLPSASTQANANKPTSPSSATSTGADVGKTGWVKVNSAGLKVRKSPNGSTLNYTLPNGMSVTILEQSDAGGYTWYRVSDPLGRTDGWVRGDFIVWADPIAAQPVPSPSTASASAAGKAPNPPIPSDAPDVVYAPSAAKQPPAAAASATSVSPSADAPSYVGKTGEIKVNSAGLNVRKAPSGALAAWKLSNGTKITVLEQQADKKATWLRVKDDQGRTGGWVDSSFVVWDDAAQA
ncbi:MAG: SpoIID/LytB domain-containing protein [Oscillospiraceae bacterium]|jgi:hypothetical protein|nr:SpoIID/LytB domain-containing protein [Oscillospiraceae bacterium]